ncbi:hypothetical protein BH11GEM2_BH11GEM2_25560 [soil metagenome]
MDDTTKLLEAFRTSDAATADSILATNAALRAMLKAPVSHDPFGSTVLAHPARNGHLAMVDVLLRHGADINARSDWWAGSFGVLDTCDVSIAPALIDRGARLDANSAARLGMLDDLIQLLNANPELVHARGGDGQTPLHVAATVEVAQELLKRGAKIDAIDVDHESTPAQYLVRDHADVARYLVTRGARTDVLLASALGALELAKKHLAGDPAALRMRVSPKWFPMQNPRAGGAIYIWTLGTGATPHSVARQFGHDEVYEFLISQSPDDLKLIRAAESGDETLVQSLLSAGTVSFATSMHDDDARSIAVAASSSNTAAVKLMLEAGWPTDVRGQDGGTPLHWAAWMGNAAMTRDLVQHGAALEDRGDHYHLAPLGWALHGSLNCWRKEQGDYAATVRVLLEAGAMRPEASSKVEASEAALEALGRR